jgi:hypothetical protein
MLFGGCGMELHGKELMRRLAGLCPSSEDAGQWQWLLQFANLLRTVHALITAGVLCAGVPNGAISK